MRSIPVVTLDWISNTDRAREQPMAHSEQQAFVRAVKVQFPAFFERCKVLEVGSWNVTGTIREHFQSCDYIGTDVAAGADVDLAVPGQNLDFPTGSFDIVISCECFEHNPYWLETFLNMARMLRPSGLFVFTCAGIGRGEHGTKRTDPRGALTALQGHPDYYRNLSRHDFVRRIDLPAHFSHHAFIDNRISKDLYFVGVKRGGAADPAEGEKIAAVRAAVRRIGFEVSWPRAFGAYAEWAFKWTLARLLGETAYHNVRRFVRPRYFRRKSPPGAGA
jgi:SAM-dependent methyltransferase